MATQRERYLAFLNRSMNDRGIRDALARLATLKGVEWALDEALDGDPDSLGCDNGILDLRTGELTPGRQEQLITRSTGILYSPEAECPRFRGFVDEIMGKDSSMVEYLQRASGYSLTGRVDEQILLYLVGKGCNGKSVLLEALRHVYGDYSTATPMDTFEERQRGAIPNDLAALRGVRLVTASESSQGGQLDEAKVKRVTGGDTISARFLYKEFFEFRPAFKIWLAANHRPSVRGTDDGIWRRLHIVPFEQSFIGREDKSLPGALRDEAPGILNWAVQGARAWYEGGLRPPPRVLSETLQCRQETDVIGRFLEECTSSGDNLSVPAGILYQRFLEWCSGNGVLRPMTNARFGREMRERGVQKDRQSSGNVYVGIGLVAKEPTPGGKLW